MSETSGADVAFFRLHRLVKRGYKPQLGTDDYGAIYLDHPGKGPSLCLFPDGTLIGMGKSPISTIKTECARDFTRFSASVPVATAWEKVRERVFTAIFFGFLGGISLLLINFIEWIWGSIFYGR